jgi:hypothetical protein
MTAFLFVHGINVRGADLERTLKVVRENLSIALPGSSVTACAWGDDLGARLQCKGSSIPGYTSARALGHVPPEVEERTRWQVLYDDPFFELRLLAISSGPDDQPRSPSELASGERTIQSLNALAANDALTQSLESVNWLPYLPPALNTLQNSAELEAVITTSASSSGALRGAIARALVASMAHDAMDEGLPALQASQRDAIVRQLQDALGGTPRGVAAWLAAPLIGLSKRVMTRYLERQRGALSDLTSPAIGDVILYQGRGGPIRARIGHAIASRAEAVCIIAHSLGGVAVIDTLLLAPALYPKVKRIITVGSQAGFFYENGALVGLGVPEPLPADFPAWTNFYDRSDMLAYLTTPLLGAKADDREVDSGQPFPQSHSAYWTSPALWKAIANLDMGWRDGH